VLCKLEEESYFPDFEMRLGIPPTCDGYPDVDTYRDLEFYLLACEPMQGNYFLQRLDPARPRCCFTTPSSQPKKRGGWPKGKSRGALTNWV